MKTKYSQMVIALVVFAALAAPLAVSARHPSDSRHPNPRGRQDNRYSQPQHRSGQSRECHWSVPPPGPPPVVVYQGYCQPPPPPPVYYWGYCPPPPPPVYYYPPCPRPAFNFVFSF